MLTAYRITKARHARSAFTGEGARVAGGRWNLPGESVVYASDSLALAAIETFVHLGDDAMHIAFVSFRIEIPDDVAVHRCHRPPRGWRAEPPELPSQLYGSRWLRAGKTAVLDVPSAIVSSERNYVLSVSHPAFKRIRIGRPLRFNFDPRLWK